MLTIGILLLSATAVFGFYDVSVTEKETLVETQTQCSGGSVESMHECFSPLYQTMHGQLGTYMQTTVIEDVVAKVTDGGHIFRGILGRVVVKKNGCGCADGTNLVPVHLLTKASTVDFYLSAKQHEIDEYKNKGYVDRGVNFWCSPEMDKCGATKSLFRHTCPTNVAFNHVLTTSTNQDTVWHDGGWSKDGIVCYIWPNQFITHNYVGQP